MTRMHKWHFKRIEMEAERDRLASSLLDVSEKIMKAHSEISKNAFDRMFDDPLEQLNEMWWRNRNADD